MRRKMAAIILSIALVLSAAYVMVPGFAKQGGAYIWDYAVSADGTEMTIHMGVSNSVGYVRKVSEYQQHGGKLYVDCYAAFGGINGSWGAKNMFVLQVDADTEVIALYRSADCYEEVLHKDENGNWQYTQR